jgi:hypothetical protein
MLEHVLEVLHSKLTQNIVEFPLEVLQTVKSATL